MIIEQQPEKHQGRLISKYSDDYIPPNVLPITIKDATCIADRLGFDKTVLKNPEPVLIQAPTGFGKTWWVINVVIPYVLQIEGKILIASNRVAASAQLKLDVVKLVEGEKSKWTKSPYLDILNDQEDFNNVKIVTLQRLYHFLNSEEGRAYSKKVSVVIIDECHYFVADSSFNRETVRLWDMLPQTFTRAKRIYLSASPEDFIEPWANGESIADPLTLERIERVIGGIPRIHNSPLRVTPYPTFTWYRFVSDKYAGLPIRYYDEESDLLARIKDTRNEGWLIFVSSKEDGQRLVGEIGKDSIFISSDSKGSPEWDILVREERLPCRVLITTSVLDCGTNISDPNLKHVVVPYVDKTVFIQALGRKRFRSTPEFTLYVKAIDMKTLNGLMKRNRDLICLSNKVNDVYYKYQYTDMNRLVDELLDSGVSQSERCLVYCDKTGQWKPNYLFRHKLFRQREFYCNLKEKITQYGISAFPRLVHQWLGQPDSYDERNWLNYNAGRRVREDLEIFLKETNNRLLATEDEQRSFSDRVHQFYFAITGTKKRKGRGKGGYLKMDALNNCFEELGIKGAVRNGGTGGGWIFTIETDADMEVASEEAE